MQSVFSNVYISSLLYNHSIFTFHNDSSITEDWAVVVGLIIMLTEIDVLRLIVATHCTYECPFIK